MVLENKCWTFKFSWNYYWFAFDKLWNHKNILPRLFSRQTGASTTVSKILYSVYLVHNVSAQQNWQPLIVCDGLNFSNNNPPAHLNITLKHKGKVALKIRFLLRQHLKYFLIICFSSLLWQLSCYSAAFKKQLFLFSHIPL